MPQTRHRTPPQQNDAPPRGPRRIVFASSTRRAYAISVPTGVKYVGSRAKRLGSRLYCMSANRDGGQPAAGKIHTVHPTSTTTTQTSARARKRYGKTPHINKNRPCASATQTNTETAARLALPVARLMTSTRLGTFCVEEAHLGEGGQRAGRV
jgi:hypothetical protein